MRFLTKEKIGIILIATVLFAIPFLWMKPSQADLGGDSSRLYYYDPVSYLKNFSIYFIFNEGIGAQTPNTYFLPHLLFLILLKHIFNSPYILISIINGLKLSVGFLAVYLIIREFLQKETLNKKNQLSAYFAGILGGIFYISATASQNVIFLWNKSIMSHSQVFLNPLMFYLVLKFFVSKNNKFLYYALFISLIFSPNFALTSAPPFFTFYPLSLLFIFIYITFVLKQKIPLKGTVFGIILFLGLHAFHLIPQFLAVMDKGSFENTRVFDTKSILHEGVEYFSAISHLGKVSTTFLIPSPLESLTWLSITGPLIIITGFLMQKSKIMLLTGIFLLITLLLTSANITKFALDLYKSLFYIPGFSMFRNFYEQWSFLHIFFYAILFGLGVKAIFIKIPFKVLPFLTIGICSLIIYASYPFLSGELVNRTQWQSNNVKTFTEIDSHYEETLQFIRSLPDEGKILTLPISDSFYQVIHGKDDGAYVGPSSISFLGGKKDYSGYQTLSPFSEEIMKLVREKKYANLMQMFSILNIRYIYHNSDPKVYEMKFPKVPYEYMRTSFPKSQKEYQDFLSKLPVQKIYTNAQYHVYEVNDNAYRPELYIANSVNTSDISTTYDKSFRNIFVKKEYCKISKETCEQEGFNKENIELKVNKINNTEYIVSISQKELPRPFILAFQNKFHNEWRITTDSNKVINNSDHFLVNNYANAWTIRPEMYGAKKDFTFTLKFEHQKYIWYGIIISVLSLIILIINSSKHFYDKRIRSE